MDLHVEQIVSPAAISAIRKAGLHKVAAAMLGVDEIDMKVAVAVLGAKAYMRRKEAAEIKNGVSAYGALTGEKIADWTPLLHQMLLPAAAGAGIAALPALTRPGPVDKDELMRNAITGAIGGGLLGGARELHLAGKENPAALSGLMHTVRTAPRNL